MGNYTRIEYSLRKKESAHNSNDGQSIAHTGRPMSYGHRSLDGPGVHLTNIDRGVMTDLTTDPINVTDLT